MVLLATGRSLTELHGVGLFIEQLIRRWLADPPAFDEPPGIRKGFLTLSEARRVLRSARPPDLRGDLQMHTTWSDGYGSVPDMALAALERGYEYIAITDHSKGLKIAGGINENELRAQGREIEKVNEEFGGNKFRVFRSIEMNLNAAGAGDMDPAALDELDLVVGSFHSQLRREEDQTERYLCALRNPSVHILGHPRGRIYNHRLGLRADWRRVFAVAAELDKAIEVDSYPDRQDIDCELLKLARDSGVKIAIDTDAHSPEQLGFIELGLASAVLAGFPADRIVNFFPCQKLLAWVQGIRERAAVAA